MKTSILDILILSFLIAFLLKSCQEKTSISYEVGKEYQKMKSEFIQGLTITKEDKK